MSLKETLKNAVGLTNPQAFVKVDDKNRFYYMLQQMHRNIKILQEVL